MSACVKVKSHLHYQTYSFIMVLHFPQHLHSRLLVRFMYGDNSRTALATRHIHFKEWDISDFL
jgi:hypothetical protein